MLPAIHSKNYGVYLCLAVANLIVSTALLLFFANALDVHAYGTYGVTSTIAGLALLLVNAGHKEALFKYASQRKNELLVHTFQSLQGWLVPCYVLALFCFLFSFWAGLAALMFLISYTTLASAAVWRGRAQYLRDAAIWPLFRLLWLVGCGSIVLFGIPLELTHIFGIGCIAISLTFLLLGGQSFLREFRVRYTQMSWPFRRPALRYFFFIEVVTVAYLKVDMLALFILGLPATDLASYFFSLQLFEAVLLLLMPLGYLFFNQINRVEPDSEDGSVFITFAMLMTFFSLGILLFWGVFGGFILEALFPLYETSRSTTEILLLALLPWGVVLLLSHKLIAQGNEPLVARVFFVGLVTHVFLNFIMVPILGPLGAAWSRVTTELLMLGQLVFVSFARSTCNKK